MKTAIPADSEHLGFLDGVRGWLSVWVFLGHVSSAVNFRAPVLDTPAKAVDLFMVVSGLLMMFHYRRRSDRQPWESPLTWRSFWIRRFCRIAPVYFFLLTVSIVFGDYFFAQQAQFLGGDIWASPTSSRLLDGLLHYTFLFGLFPSHCATTPLPDWSISLEMQFYALFPFLVLASRRLGLLKAGVIASAITAISAGFLWRVYDLGQPKLLGDFPQPSLILLKIGLFFSGMMGAEAIALKGRSSKAAIMAGVGAFLVAAFVSSKLVTVVVGVILVLALWPVDSGLLGGATLFRALRSCLSSRFSTFLAERSYSLYLAHTLVLFTIGVWLNRWHWFALASPALRFATLSGACAAVLIPVTGLLYVGLEVPGIALGKRMSESRPRAELRLSPSAAP